MRAPMTLDRALEVLSRYGEAQEVLTVLLSIAGWYCVQEQPVRLYAPTPDGPGVTDSEAARQIADEARRHIDSLRQLA